MTAMAPNAWTGCAACSRSRYGTSATKRLFCARDRFGIKPFYYAVVGNLFVFASEAKALLPFLPEIATDPEALAEYLTFQYTIGERDAVPRRQAAAAGPCTDRREWRGARSGAIGTSATRSISITAPGISSAASPNCSTTRSMFICAATCRSAPMFRAASIRA